MGYRAHRELAKAAGVKFSSIASCLLASTDLEFVELESKFKTEYPTEWPSNTLVEYTSNRLAE